MRQKLLLLGAVVFGLLAFVLTYRQLEAEKRRILGDSETVVLIRITRNMVENEEIRETDVARHPVQRRREARGFSREIPWSEVSRVIGRRLETSMSANQILLSTDLKPMSRRQGFTGVIQSGWRAVSIPVDPISSVNYLIQPGDNVDVIGTFRFPDVRGGCRAGYGHADHSAGCEGSGGGEPLGGVGVRSGRGRAQLRHRDIAALPRGGGDDRLRRAEGAADPLVAEL